MRYLWFLLFPFFCLATTSTPFTVDLDVGYREDVLKLKVYRHGNPSTTIYAERYRDLRFLQSDITIRTLQRDFFLFINGGYAAIGKGDLRQGPFLLDFTTQTPTFHFSTTADAFHALGLFGILVNLTPERYYTIALTPFGGYEGYWERIKRKNPSPDPGSYSLGDNAYFDMSSSLPNKEKIRWNGFLFGGIITVHPGGDFWFDVCYAYHFTSLKDEISAQYQINNFTAPDLLATTTYTNIHAIGKTKKGNGQSGYVRGSYHFSKSWEASLLGKIVYFTSHIHNLNWQISSTQSFPVYSQINSENQRKFKLTHLMLTFLFQITYKI